MVAFSMWGATFPVYIPNYLISLAPVEIKDRHIKYRGYGSDTAKLFFKQSGNKIITAICLAEHGGLIPVNGNVGNLRYTKQYESYSSWQEGMKQLTKVLNKKRYKSCFNLEGINCIKCIQQSGYSPSPLWVDRVSHWYNLIK